MIVLVLQRLLLEAMLDLVYFPLWWYTNGLVHAGQWCLELLQTGNNRLVPGIWLRNIFVPMYGQYDWQGRVISFGIRCVQILARSVMLLAWLAVCAALFLLWAIIPIIVSYGIFSALIKSK